jgi:hypothetical protein
VAYWADTNRLSALGSLFGFVVTALLVGITIEYVRTNQSSLRLLKAQWKAQSKVEIKFGLRAQGDVAQVWVLNYGVPNVLFTKLVVQLPGKTPRTVYKNAVIPTGQKKRYDLPHRDWGKLDTEQDVQVTMFYESTTERFEQTKVYTLYLTERSQVDKVRKGLHSLWAVGCPKCEKLAGVFMVTDGVKTFDEAHERQKEVEADLAATCPQHASKWMLTMEHVTKPQTEEIDA